jgi:hypothetical protein
MLNMRRLIIHRLSLAILVSISLSFRVTAQNYVPSRGDVESFLKTKTLVVLESNPMSMYNTWIREAVEQNWTITEYDFILFNEFDNYKNDQGYSFLMTTDVFFERDKLKARYKFLNLLLGGDARKLSDMPDLCPVPLAYLNADEENYNYKLGIFVRFIQNHVQLLMNDPKISSKNVFRHYNDNLLSDVKNKTLYLLKNELAPDVNTKEKIASVYPFKVEIVEKEEIELAIARRDPDVVFLHKVGPEGTRLKARCYKVLIGAADARFYFFDHHMIKAPKKPDGLLMGDFRRMAKK